MVSNLCQLISDAAKKRPNHKAVIEAQTGHWVTYKELDNKIKAFSACLSRQGLKRGERVGILSRNSIAGIAAFFAISKTGGIIVPFNCELDPLDAAWQARHCGLSALYAGTGFSEKAKRISSRVKSIRFVLDEAKRRVYEGSGKKVFVAERKPALIIYTSGTTGEPLGVTLSHKNLISNSKAIVKYTGISSADNICCILPLHYIYGLSLVLSHFLGGGTIVLDNRFMYPNVILDTIDRYKATGFAGVSSHYAILLYKSDLKNRELPSLKYFTQAGDAMPPHITRALGRTFPDKKLYLMYGLTEASPRLTYLDPGLVLKKPTSVGKAIPGVEVRVVASGFAAQAKAKECRPNQTGEIAARGSNIMIGYWNNARETSRKIKKGWLYTGDLGFKDKDGDLFIIGRKEKFIKVGGKRVGLFEIEQLAMKNDAVMEAVAVGFGDYILGEKVKLFIALIPGRKVSVEKLMILYKSRFPSYKVPSEIVILKAIPKNNCGKINMEELGVA